MKTLSLLFCLITFQNLKSQDFNTFIQHLKVYNLQYLDESAYDRLSVNEKSYLIFEIKLIKHVKLDTFLFNNVKSSQTNFNKNDILNNIILGDFHLFKPISNDSLSIDFYKKALDFSLKIKDTVLIAESFKKIIQQLSQNRSANELALNYVQKYESYLYDLNEKATYLYYKNITLASIDNKEKINGLKNGLKIANKTENDYLKAKYNQMIGVFFSYFKKEKDSALVYMQRARVLLESKPYQIFKNELFGIYGNIGQYIEKQGDYKLAKTYYLKANEIKVPKYRYLVKVKLNEVLAENALKRNLKDSAYYYLKQSNIYKDTLNEYNKAKSLIDLDKKYQTAEKEKQILVAEQNNKQIRNFLIASLLFIILGGTIGFLILKNSRRKRKLAEQETELETQKNLNLLKEQEITIINAMVDGQEKERKQIAEDLHDNLGSVLATLKMHFENLQINKDKKKINQDELFDKTESLIDEAYLKVRSIAHAKNAGVIANQGLLIAVQMMAEKISSADKIKIEVIDYSLNKRLDNSLEISVFRTIQELITNVIKHAEANNITINISLFDNNLNIIIEDDGKGFDALKIDTTKGMGITSIKTRINHLRGTFEIDSTLEKGTSIIINIPVE